jgi:hypothetical protein
MRALGSDGCSVHALGRGRTLQIDSTLESTLIGVTKGSDEPPPTTQAQFPRTNPAAKCLAVLMLGR